MSFLDQGGVAGLQGFVRATYQFVREERPCLVMVDGDSAGDKCRRELQGYLGNKKIPFEANRHFIVVRDRFTIEGLFPDEWIIQLHNQHPGWLEGFSLDAAGTLLPFTVSDNSKRQFMAWMRAKADAEADLNWASRWTSLLAVVEQALHAEAKRIYEGDAQVASILAYSATAANYHEAEALTELLKSPILEDVSVAPHTDP